MQRTGFVVTAIAAVALSGCYSAAPVYSGYDPLGPSNPAWGQLSATGAQLLRQPRPYYGPATPDPRDCQIVDPQSGSPPYLVCP